MLVYEEGLRFCERWPCRTYISTDLTIRGLREVLVSTHIDHVSVSPTDGNGPTKGQGKTLTRVGIESVQL